MDLLVITPEGNFKIYDMKTASQWSRFGEQGDNQDGYFKKEGYALQLAIYKNLLENLTGVPVESLELLGFQTTNDLKGNISDIKVVDNKAKTTINYNTYKVTPEKTLKDVVSEYVPSDLEKGIDLGAEVNPEAKAQLNTMGYTNIEVAEAKEEAPVEEVSPIDLFNAMSIEEKWTSLINDMKPEDVLDVDNLYSAGVMQVKITTPGPHQGKILDVTNQLANAPRKVNLEDPASVIMLQKITKDFKGDGKMRPAIEVNNYLGDVFGYVRENTPGAVKESPVETSVEKTATAEAISKDINIDTLRVAKQKNYEVMYESLDNPEKNGRYLITKITKNSVTLANLNDKITVKTKDLATNIKSVLDNVEPVTSVEDKKVIKENTQVKEEPKFTFTRLNKDERFKNTNDKTC